MRVISLRIGSAVVPLPWWRQGRIRKLGELGKRIDVRGF